MEVMISRIGSSSSTTRIRSDGMVRASVYPKSVAWLALSRVIQSNHRQIEKSSLGKKSMLLEDSDLRVENCDEFSDQRRAHIGTGHRKNDSTGSGCSDHIGSQPGSISYFSRALFAGVDRRL